MNGPVDEALMGLVASQLMERLLLENPFEGFPRELFPPDPDGPRGWGYRHPIFDLLIELQRPTIIIEVGTWRGASAIRMARACKQHGLDAAVICIDTWLGSPEHIRDPKRNRHTRELNPQFGYPRLYHAFLSNVLEAGCEDMIIPLPATSDNAAVVLAGYRLNADLIYIDAAHEYEPVLRDLRAYWALLAEGGFLVGDDYLGWDGVTKAADEFAADNRLDLVGGRGKFVVGKTVEIPGAIRECFAQLELRQAATNRRRAEAARESA